MRKLFTLMMLLIASLTAVKAMEATGTLPILHIDIENGAEVVTKETYLNATYWLESKGADWCTDLGSQAEPLVMKIKGRGNYTFTGFDKKPYRLKLDSKQPLLGMEKSKHFGLLAHADDNRGFLRNTVGFAVSKALGLPWTPEQRPVEVMVNGTYRGLYFATELIRIDKKRVNVTAWQEEYTDDAGNVIPYDKWIEGGTIVEIDNYVEPAGQICITDGNNVDMHITYDKSVDPGFEPDGYVDWLKAQFVKLNSLIFGDKNSDELWQYLDLDDCARFILTQEITCNYESFHGSCYLHREKGDGEKWHFSPVWDFGSAFNAESQSNKHFWECSQYHSHWVAELYKFEKLRKRMGELYSQYLANDKAAIDQLIRDHVAQVRTAAERDHQRWPDYGTSDMNWALNNVTGFLAQKATWLTNTLPNVGEIPVIPDDPIDFTVPADEQGVYHLFFDASTKPEGWSQVCFHYWGAGSTTWPGNATTLVKVDGKLYYHYELRTNDGQDHDNIGIIFNDGQDHGNISGKVGNSQTDDLKAVKRGVYSLSTSRNGYDSQLPVNGQGGDDPVIPDNPGKFTVTFIDSHSSPWTDVCVWIWGNAGNYTSNKNWPGDAMTPYNPAAAPALSARAAGNIWTYEVNLPDNHSGEAKIIFNGLNSDNNREQTTQEGHTLATETTYTRTDTGVVLGTEAIEAVAVATPDVKVVNGIVVITCATDMTIPVVTLDGRVRTYAVAAGVTMLHLERGIYIVAGKKVAVTR